MHTSGCIAILVPTGKIPYRGQALIECLCQQGFRSPSTVTAKHDQPMLLCLNQADEAVSLLVDEMEDETKTKSGSISEGRRLSVETITYLAKEIKKQADHNLRKELGSSALGASLQTWMTAFEPYEKINRRYSLAKKGITEDILLQIGVKTATHVLLWMATYVASDKLGVDDPSMPECRQIFFHVAPEPINFWDVLTKSMDSDSRLVTIKFDNFEEQLRFQAPAGSDIKALESSLGQHGLQLSGGDI
eukprot:g25662.t1